MKAQFVFLLFLLSSVVATTVTKTLLWNQPPLEQNDLSPDSGMSERSVAYGVAAPRSFSAPTQNGFNFDSFASDDFYVSAYSQLWEVWVAVAVDQLDSYTIDSVYLAIYPDIGGLPNYDPYSPDSPAPTWSMSVDWASDDPDAEFPLPWLSNPLRKGAINVAVDIALQPGAYWLTMHFEISQSSISIPPVQWLPGKTQGESGSPARLYVPGDNPSAGASNSFAWYWNSLRRNGLGDLSFRFYGWTAQFSVITNAIENQYFYRCAGEGHILVNLTIAYFDTSNWNESIILTPMFPVGSPLDFKWEGNDTLTSNMPDTAFRLRYFTQGNDYQFTLNFTGYDGITWWLQNFTVRAVNDPLEDPQWVVRDEYGLIGGLFQWRASSISENFDFEIDEDGGDFSMPELSVTLPGYLRTYRPTLSDYDLAGNVSAFGPRPQAFYVARIRAVNPDCNQTSMWITLRFQSDECEMMSTTFTNGTYNFQKGKFVTNSWALTDYGTIMDFRVRVRGFHQRWSDVGLAVKTPVTKEGNTVDIPLFAEDCDLNWDTNNQHTKSQHFEIFFAIGGIDDSLCPRPPIQADPANTTYVEPWGVNVFKNFVLGQDKRGLWALEWIDYGIGFPTNGKISDYDALICSIPVPPREHIIYKGESKVRRGTVAVYGP